MVFVNNEQIGSLDVFLQWALVGFNFEDYRNDSLYETLRKEDFAAYLANSQVDFFKLN
jgi:hypothetical protein